MALPQTPTLVLFSADDFVETMDGGDDDDKNDAKNNDQEIDRTSSGGATLMECLAVDETERLKDRLKRELFQLGASYDRGFGANSAARDKALRVIKNLEQLNQEKNAAGGIDGELLTSPLTGVWRMVWTTAFDVLSLQASPLTIIGAVHQVVEPPIITNVIDWIPRAELLLPPNVLPSSLFRAKVKTRASSRTNKPNRVGLVFEAVQIQPLEVLGMKLDVFPPLGWDIPRLPQELIDSLLPALNIDAAESPGYFDVTYLDDEVLIIRQNEPGGLFASIRVDSLDS